MRHKSNNKTRPLFTLSLEMTRLVNETRLLLVPCFNSDIYSKWHYGFVIQLISGAFEHSMLAYTGKLSFVKYGALHYSLWAIQTIYFPYVYTKHGMS